MENINLQTDKPEQVKQVSRTKQLELLTDSQHKDLHVIVATANPFASRDNFAIWVSVQYQFQKLISDLYSNPTLKALLPDLEDRSRLPAAESDLIDLGQAIPQVNVMKAADFSTAQALGWLFVSEGSTLGAAILRKKAAEKLGLSDDFGARHLASSPEGRGKQWKKFMEVINGLPLDEQENINMGIAAQNAFTYFSNALNNAYGLND